MPTDRPALDAAALRSRLVGGFVTALDVVGETSSTNADLVAAAAEGAPEGTVLVAEFQHAGRGRFMRTWASPARAGLTFSLLVRPASVPVTRWGWLPLLTGVAAHDAVRALLPPGVDVVLKWPNDLLLGAPGQKAAGILAEAGAGWVVIGVGVNVDHESRELPSEQAVSLRMYTDRPVDRAALLAALLDAFAVGYRRWIAAAGDPSASGLSRAYVRACATLGREVEVRRPAGTDVGRAVAVDAHGALVVDTAGGSVTVSAGDVVHVRARDR